MLPYVNTTTQLHHNTHTGEKREILHLQSLRVLTCYILAFACPFPGCGRCFSVLSNMRRHARVHGNPSSRRPRASSAEDNFEASTVYSSSSSTHNTPVIPQAAIISSSSGQYFHSRSLPSATSSPLTRPQSRLEMLRHPSLAKPRPYSYKRSQSPLSDRGASSPER